MLSVSHTGRDMDDITPIRKPENIGEAGGLVDESRLTLGVHGEEVDPDEISRCSVALRHRLIVAAQTSARVFSSGSPPV